MEGGGREWRGREGVEGGGREGGREGGEGRGRDLLFLSHFVSAPKCCDLVLRAS